MNSRRVDECVEQLCLKGCKALWQEIEAMDRGEFPPELDHLDAREKAAVLAEIKSIMAVYRGSCSL